MSNHNIQLAPSKDILSEATLHSASIPLRPSRAHVLKVVTHFSIEQTQLYIVALSNDSMTDSSQPESGQTFEQIKQELGYCLNGEGVLQDAHESCISVLDCFEAEGRRYVVVQAAPLAVQDIPSATAKALSVYEQSFDRVMLQQLLTPREQEIICLIAAGLPNKQIASRLDISVWTVSAHLRRIFIKLKVDTRAAVVYQCSKLIQSWE